MILTGILNLLRRTYGHIAPGLRAACVGANAVMTAFALLAGYVERASAMELALILGLMRVPPFSPCSRALSGGSRAEEIRVMQNAVRTLFIIALLVTASATGQQEAPAAEPSITLPPELARMLTDYEAAWSKKDAAALAELFAEDGFALAGGKPPVRGRAAIEKHYTGQGGPLSLRAFAYAAEGAVGYILGGYTDKAGNPDFGKFTLTLRKGPDGRWLIMSDMDNANRRRE